MAEWDIQIGETLLRKELHDRWGGGRYGGMEPALKAASVFLFTNPRAGDVFGYKYDGWHSDGTFHYTGDGQVGDQSLSYGGNRAVMDASLRRRQIRMFRSNGRWTTYLGVFELADPPYYRADAPDRTGLVRSVLVFRLLPGAGAIVDPADDAGPEQASVVEVPVEAADVDRYVMDHPDEPVQATRREAKLVARYVEWLAARGHDAVRHRVPLPGGGHLYTDVYNVQTSELIEAKGSGARAHVRAGLGQILDYARYVDHQSLALLLPVRPSDDLIDLLHQHGCHVIWQDGARFDREDRWWPLG